MKSSEVQNHEIGERARVIVLRPSPELARQIDEAARADKRSAPAWIFVQIDKALAEHSAIAGGAR